jgi:hypothetical protein
MMPHIASPTIVDTMAYVDRVVYAGDYRLYEISSRQIGVDSVLLYDSLLFTYYVHRKDEQFGYIFNSLADTASAKKINVDSVIINAGMKPLVIPPQFKIDGYARSIKKGDSEMVYAYYVGGDSSKIDTAYFYYNTAYIGVKHSLSPTLDSSFKSKLYKIEYLAQEYSGENAAYINQFRKVIFKMKPVPVTNEKELDAFFERYKKIEAALKP